MIITRNLMEPISFFSAVGKAFVDSNIVKPTASRKVFQRSFEENDEKPKLDSNIPNYLKMTQSNLSASLNTKNFKTIEMDKSLASPTSTMAKLQGSAFNAIIKTKSHHFVEQSFKSFSTKTTTLCHEILVNSVLKIFHHPSISLFPLKDRMHFAISQWPLIWILYLGRKTAQNETKIIMQKLIEPPKIPTLSPSSISSLLCLINSLRSLSLDQAEYGLIETILISKIGRKGNL